LDKFYKFILNISYIQSHSVNSQSVPVTTKVVNLNPTHGKMYSIQHYVIKWQISGFLRILRFPPSIKLTITK